MSRVETINATEFKAKCLGLLDRVSGRELDRLEITKRGRLVAVVTPPPETPGENWIQELQVRMRGRTHIPEDWDLTAPIFEGEINPDPDGLLDR